MFLTHRIEPQITALAMKQGQRRPNQTNSLYNPLISHAKPRDLNDCARFKHCWVNVFPRVNLLNSPSIFQSALLVTIIGVFVINALSNAMENYKICLD